jgi:CDP-diacylglycerol--serine O-phosphatidyltransferase
MTRSRRLRRGIYLLPTLFTIGNLFCGYSSVVLAAEGMIAQAALLIVLAGILDGLDGRIARLTGTTSDFGVQFDSLADIVSFGIAPAILAYHWALAPLGRFGWLIAFIFVVCAAMRLARFNIQGPRADKRFFAGMPSPPAAGVLACVVFAFPETPQAGLVLLLIAILVTSLGMLMISRFRYRSFKDLDLRNRRSYIWVLPLAGIIVAVVFRPRIVLLVLSGAYLISAPAAAIWNLLSPGRGARSTSGEHGAIDESTAR